MKIELIEIFGRDILRLKDEINSFKHEKMIWAAAPGIHNSAGNLCLHLVGNLNHFIGALLGHTGYKRERDLEFSMKDIPLAQLRDTIDRTREVVITALSGMDEQDFELDFPEQRDGKTLKTSFMLLHLLAHLGYHLGQINYLRRLLEK